MVSTTAAIPTGFDAEMIGASAYHEVGFIFEAKSAASGNEVNGTLCVLGRSNEDYMEVFGRMRPLGDQPINHTSDAPLSVPTLFASDVQGAFGYVFVVRKH